MKLISLNVWGGHEYDALTKFIGEHAHDTDIFCFQEMCSSENGPEVSNGTRTNIMRDIGGLLKGFAEESSAFESGFDEIGPVDFDITWSQVTFVRDGIDIIDSGAIEIHEGDETRRAEFDHRCVMQHMTLQNDGKQFIVCNVQGVTCPGSKLDTPERLRQSERIKAFLAGVEGPTVLCGDFNLMPETKSIRMFEDDLENLITTHGIKTTRGSLNPYFGTPQQQDFADYAFVSSGITVEQFVVPDARVSDHCPMILTFSLETCIDDGKHGLVRKPPLVRRV